MIKYRTQILLSATIFLTIACIAIMGESPKEATPVSISSPTMEASPVVAATSTEIVEPTKTPRPTPRPIICEDDSCLNACLERIGTALQTHEMEQVGGAYEGTDANLNLVVYKVNGNKLGEPDFLFTPAAFKPLQQNTSAQLLVWNYASALLPPEQLKWIDEFHIFTDGPYNTLAWVYAEDDLDRSKWQLGIDIADAEDPVYLTNTLVHEFGHLITLNSDQIPATEFSWGWSQNSATCKQFSMPEGCTHPDSYVNLFYQKFWVSIFDEWRATVEKVHTNSPDEFRALVAEFYDRHADDFVREYAATNIREDMAESFMNFVLSPKPNDDTLYIQKMNFFYDFPELVALRQQMIQNICSYTE